MCFGIALQGRIGLGCLFGTRIGLLWLGSCPLLALACVPAVKGGKWRRVGLAEYWQGTLKIQVLYGTCDGGWRRKVRCLRSSCEGLPYRVTDTGGLSSYAFAYIP